MIRILLAAESASDAELIRQLVDTAVMKRADWITPDVLGDYRCWSGLDDHATFVDLHKVRDLAQEHNIRAYGHFDGKPGAEDAAMNRKLFQLVGMLAIDANAVVVSRDTDGKKERVEGLQQAATAGDYPFSIVRALAHQELEAWEVALWTPKDDEDNACLKEVRKDINFDPTREPHRLTAKNQNNKRDAKRVLDMLTNKGATRHDRRERLTLDGTDKKLHVECGLVRFCEDIREHLLPHFTGGGT